MTLQLIQIRQLQSQLDERIMINHGVNRTETRLKRILALMVEIGELANETRSFKFWSTKKASEKEVILEELGDCVHFTISLGLDLGDTRETLEFVPKAQALSEQFIDWMSECAKLKTDFTDAQYQVVLGYIGSVALAMDFDAQAVTAFYLKKNEINHTRQDKQY